MRSNVPRRTLIEGTLGLVGLGVGASGCSTDEAEFERVKRVPSASDASRGTGAPTSPSGANTNSDVGPIFKKAIAELPVSTDAFPLGVASGDPLADRVILWTRIRTANTKATSLTVRWVVAKDPSLKQVVQQGVVQTGPERAFTVKVDAKGLLPGETYYYAFGWDDVSRSITGRTRTLPAGSVSRMRIALTTCSNYTHGFFNAYRCIAKRADVDLWVHLGDYIYEYAARVYGTETPGRLLDPTHEAVTLDDYRRRYAHHRGDPDLQELHRQHPMIAIWDDHEFADNCWHGGAANHLDGQGSWSTRRDAAARAFLEWMPIREGGLATDGVPVIYRSFPLGNLGDLIMLDTRLVGRDRIPGVEDPLGESKGDPAMRADKKRSILGFPQEAWLHGELAKSQQRGARWRLVGNQVLLASVRDARDNSILTADSWDGYEASRDRLFEAMQTAKVDNLVVLTGDVHISMAMHVAPKPWDSGGFDATTGKGAVAVEIVPPSITSPALEFSSAAGMVPTALTYSNPHIAWTEVTRKGYVMLDVTEQQVQAEWFFVMDYKRRDDAEELAKIYACTSGTPFLKAKENTEVSVPRPDAPALAPDPKVATAAFSMTDDEAR